MNPTETLKDRIANATSKARRVAREKLNRERDEQDRFDDAALLVISQVKDLGRVTRVNPDGGELCADVVVERDREFGRVSVVLRRSDREYRQVIVECARLSRDDSRMRIDIIGHGDHHRLDGESICWIPVEQVLRNLDTIHAWINDGLLAWVTANDD